MPDRYSIIANGEKLAKRFDVEVTEAYKPRYNAAPTQLLPVITNENPEGFSFFYWGTIPQWTKNNAVSLKLINADAESITQKASLKNSFLKRRCLVPADGFFEWRIMGKKSKVPYRIFLDGNEPFAFAGLWDEYEDENNQMVHTFMILTTQANSSVKYIHERMPVILTPDTEKLWLNSNVKPEDLVKLLVPYSAERMGSYTVSPLVNIISNDRPEVIQPAPAADQFGNYTLFS